MDRIFINNHGNAGWIMQILAEDITKMASAMGYSCKVGDTTDYDGEEIYFDYDYHIAVPMPQARHNSIFYTHLNDKLTEVHLCEMKDKFDSFICMSPEDAEFLIELGFDKSKVFGRTLPVRNTYVKPISIGMFSANYSDGRKNEDWLIEYCKKNENSKLANFVFIGSRWGHVLDRIEQAGCSATWVNIQRNLPFEYQYQQNLLSNLDYYFYMGMDGGAMGTYDAYAQCVKLCVTYDGFHKSIPDIEHSFDNKKTFFKELNTILEKQRKRLDFFSDNSPEKYVNWLISVWVNSTDEEIGTKEKKCISYNSVLEKKREQYYPTTWSRFIRSVYWKYAQIKAIKIATKDLMSLKKYE